MNRGWDTKPPRMCCISSSEARRAPGGEAILALSCYFSASPDVQRFHSRPASAQSRREALRQNQDRPEVPSRAAQIPGFIFRGGEAGHGGKMRGLQQFGDQATKQNPANGKEGGVTVWRGRPDIHICVVDSTYAGGTSSARTIVQGKVLSTERNSRGIYRRASERWDDRLCCQFHLSRWAQSDRAEKKAAASMRPAAEVE
jgi:hypothetical protein